MVGIRKCGNSYQRTVSLDYDSEGKKPYHVNAYEEIRPIPQQVKQFFYMAILKRVHARWTKPLYSYSGMVADGFFEIRIGAVLAF
ncbi:hypothetical protein LQZ18_01190 [Lachnospiraceae bacterium ZAX-1]